MKKKLVFTLITTAFVMVTMTACGTKEAASGKNVLRVGLDDTYPPMEFVDESGSKTIGFDIDFAEAVGQELGMEVEIVSNAWEGIFSALNSDKFDCIISAVSITDDRIEEFNMSTPYFGNNLVIVTNPDNMSIKSPEDLKTYKAAVQTNTTADDFLAEFLGDGNYAEYDALTQAFDDLKIGRVDAVCVDIVCAKYYTAKDKDNFKVVWESDEPDKFAVCVKKGNDELSANIETAIENLYKSGKVKELSEKWFGEDLTAGIRD